VILPGSTCLLNSFSPSSYAAAFYNLHVPSGVTLQGVGSKLLQGPGGRQSISKIPGATSIGNTVIAVGNNYAAVNFQNRGNGGFYSLQAISATVRTEFGRETLFKILRLVLGNTPRTSP
jgi:hypothetical protein